MRASPLHLVRRFAGALSRREPPASDESWVRSWLLEGEFDLWSGMPAHDRRHSIDVARRYVTLSADDVRRDEIAAALLHDIGKTVASLGVVGRVAATIVGPRGARFVAYHDHERIGAELCHREGSSHLTCSMIDGSADAGLVDRLRRADDI